MAVNRHVNEIIILFFPFHLSDRVGYCTVICILFPTVKRKTKKKKITFIIIIWVGWRLRLPGGMTGEGSAIAPTQRPLLLPAAHEFPGLVGASDSSIG